MENLNEILIELVGYDNFMIRDNKIFLKKGLLNGKLIIDLYKNGVLIQTPVFLTKRSPQYKNFDWLLYYIII